MRLPLYKEDLMTCCESRDHWAPCELIQQIQKTCCNKVFEGMGHEASKVAGAADWGWLSSTVSVSEPKVDPWAFVDISTGDPSLGATPSLPTNSWSSVPQPKQTSSTDISTVDPTLDATSSLPANSTSSIPQPKQNLSLDLSPRGVFYAWEVTSVILFYLPRPSVQGHINPLNSLLCVCLFVSVCCCVHVWH